MPIHDNDTRSWAYFKLRSLHRCDREKFWRSPERLARRPSQSPPSPVYLRRDRRNAVLTSGVKHTPFIRSPVQCHQHACKRYQIYWAIECNKNPFLSAFALCPSPTKICVPGLRARASNRAESGRPEKPTKVSFKTRIRLCLPSHHQAKPIHTASVRSTKRMPGRTRTTPTFSPTIRSSSIMNPEYTAQRSFLTA